MHSCFVLGDFGEEGGRDRKLPFSEEMHRNRTVDEVFLVGECVVLGTRKGSIFEQL